MSDTPPPGRRGPRARVAVVVGAGLLAIGATVLLSTGSPEPAVVAAGAPSALDRAITTAREKLAKRDQDPRTWAELGAAYVEAARAKADPTYYPKAEEALRKSVAQQPDGNGIALAGLGALANARHDFAAARDWGVKAREVLPDNAQVYGVLTDAYTQLGDTEAATTALQRMLDLKPGVSSFTRAAYEFELHGRVDDARHALERALADAVDPGDVVFCRHLLGKLAFDNGDLDTAQRHFDAGLRAVPDAGPLLQGRATVLAARGRTGEALAGFEDLVTRQPNLDNLQEYALLLTSAGAPEPAARQYAVIERQQRVDAESGANIDLEASLVAVDRGNARQALELAQAEWARRQPVFVADAVAWALHLNGRDAEALSYADRAASTGWRSAAVAYHRGMILAGLGRTPEAVAALTEALRINPHFSATGAPAARAALAKLGGTR
ncbi:tetratricopeptide repeat protein [Amycolatopsis solani]|uniref:tetratricopeptide repeat protein n=1 Tax=Amycolatopsis solani TaxID=3028615 RepID=UPI0025B0F4D7|nr:tetratricopeptide repeat protein [Amycolatopsis sp. MEP2-6]